MTMTVPLRTLLAREEGAAAVETVLILPLAIFLLVLALEAGNYLYSEHQVTVGVRDAARYAGRLPWSTYGCTAASGETDLPAGTAWTNIANVAVYGQVNPGNSPAKRLWTWDVSASEISIRYACVANSTGLYATIDYVPVVSVSGRPNYPSLFATMTGFDSSLRLFAKNQAIGTGL